MHYRYKYIVNNVCVNVAITYAHRLNKVRELANKRLERFVLYPRLTKQQPPLISGFPSTLLYLTFCGSYYAMPSFLSKVFGRKKDEKDTPSPTSPTTEKRSSAPPLLDGKYEAVSPAHPSPSTSSFQDNTRLTTGPSKDSPLALFRPKSKNVEHAKKSNVNQAPAPHLTLNLPANKEESNRALDVVFESVPEEPAEKDLGERRLTPAETLKLVQASSKAIIEHGGEHACQ